MPDGTITNTRCQAVPSMSRRGLVRWMERLGHAQSPDGPPQTWTVEVKIYNL